MFEDVLGQGPKVVIAYVHTRVQLVPSLVLLVHLGGEETYSFGRNQSRMQMVCLAEAER